MRDQERSVVNVQPHFKQKPQEFEEVMERSQTLTPSSRVKVLEKWPEHVVQLHWRPKHFGDASVTGWLPRTVVAVEWSQPKPGDKLQAV